MRFVYADPPYPGQAQKHYGDHPDFDGEVDHAELIARLERDYDGWALSTNCKSLQKILAMCPTGVPNPKRPGCEKEGSGIRVLCWHKPMAPHFPETISYMWEPVILRGWRPPKRGHPQPLDHLTLSPPGYTFTQAPDGHVIGEKPPGFCRWLFQCAGLEADDDFIDLFPGSGAVSAEWDRWRNEPTIFAPGTHPLDTKRNARRELEATHPQLLEDPA